MRGKKNALLQKQYALLQYTFFNIEKKIKQLV